MGRVYTTECAVSGAFNGIPMMSCEARNTEAQLACVAVQWALRVFAPRTPNSPFLLERLPRRLKHSYLLVETL